MSPPSHSATFPTLLISDVDMVIVYDSEGEEFEHWRQAELSVVVVGSPGGPRRAKFCPAVPQLVAGDVEGVPPLQQIPQAEVTAEEFARALAQAWGPLTLEWCQNKAPCVLCAWQGKACIFDAPSPQEVLDLVGVASGMCCRGAGVGQGLGAESAGQGVEDLDVGGDECGAVCGAGGASVGWAEGGGILSSRPWKVESFPAIRGGAQQEAMRVQADGGSSRVSCSLSYPGRGLGTGIKFSRAPAFNHRGLPLQVGGGANGSADSVGGGASMVRVAPERVPEVQGLREHLTQWGVRPMEEAEEQEMALESGPLWVELEVARQREDWLANEAASGCAGILRWVWEHRVLLDGASAEFTSIQDGLAQMPVGQPLELQQGMARVGRLLAGHQWHNVVAPGLWWEVAADMGEAFPGLAEVLAVVRAQMEIDLGVGMAGVLGEE
ncbi:hypothetical protein E4T56_gene3188 [Termitomyces sp. T112]|nr:hypothetical protein E4T56_gene3188 [Termitomyces sp. T112]